MSHDPALLGRISERRVLRLLQAAGPLSRAELARRSGLSAPAVSRAVAALQSSGMLEELAEVHATGGRPAIRYRPATRAAQVVGVAVDADVCRVVAAGLDGVLLGEAKSFATPSRYEDLLDELEAAAAGYTSRPGVATLGVGLSLPGLVDYRQQRSLLSPNLHLTDGRAVAADLADRLGVECLLLQESHALCLAEQHYGGARGVADFAMLDVHTGVGLGVVSGGNFLTGHSGLAGEIGHITVVPDGRACGCGNRGCLETVAGDAALARLVGERLGRSVRIDEVVAMKRAGADVSAEVAAVSGYMAIALGAVVNLYNPRRLFVHGGLFDLDDGLFAAVVALAKSRALRPAFADCVILRATGDKVRGAVAGIIQRLTTAIAPSLETDPLRFPTEVRHAIPAT